MIIKPCLVRIGKKQNVFEQDLVKTVFAARYSHPFCKTAHLYALNGLKSAFLDVYILYTINVSIKGYKYEYTLFVAYNKYTDK